MRFCIQRLKLRIICQSSYFLFCTITFDYLSYHQELGVISMVNKISLTKSWRLDCWNWMNFKVTSYVTAKRKTIYRIFTSYLYVCIQCIKQYWNIFIGRCGNLTTVLTSSSQRPIISYPPYLHNLYFLPPSLASIVHDSYTIKILTVNLYFELISCFIPGGLYANFSFFHFLSIYLSFL